MRRYWIPLCAALLLGGCDGTENQQPPPAAPGDPTFGLQSRVPLQGINIPTGLPSKSSLSIVRAFPALSFGAPVALVSPEDGSNRLFVVQLEGQIYHFDNDDAVSLGSETLFLDIDPRVFSGGERGLLGLAFHPDFANNGYFYVYYSATTTTPRQDHRSVVSRFNVSAADPSVADPNSEVVLLTFDQPFSNHNGGCLQFGDDGKLYISTGDGGSGNDPINAGQRLDTLLGKMLRLNDDGTIPADNPFVGNPNALDEIWAYGLRNPWRFSFDRMTGELWCGDVGQNAREEIDLISAGDNLGWRIYEGNRSNINPNGDPPDAFTQPILDYDHGLGFSVTGGYVYRGSQLASLAGAYVYGDFGSGRVWAMVYDGAQVVSNEQIGTVDSLSSFGEDAAGEVYLVSINGGIFRFQESGGGAPVPATLSATGLFVDTANLVPTGGLVEYDVNSPLWSDHATKRRWIGVPGTQQITFDATGDWQFPIGTVLVKHFELETSALIFRRLETRVLIQHTEGWRGYTYRWNVGETDANLIDEAETETISVDATAAGGARDQEWYFPSRADCLTCHTTAAGRILGVRTRQLNRDRAYPTVTDNQLRSWNHIGLFASDIGDHAQYAALPDPHDPTATVVSRARSYLATNCAMCHQPGGPTPVTLDLRYDTPVANLDAVGVAATNPVDGTPGALRIEAGVKESSDLWIRLMRLDQYRMPPLASNLVDEAAHDLLGMWIDSGATD